MRHGSEKTCSGWHDLSSRREYSKGVEVKKQVLQHPVTSYIIPRHLGHQVTHVTIRWMLCTFSFFHFFIFYFFPILFKPEPSPKGLHIPT